MSKNEPPESGNRSGGGIVFGGGSRSTRGPSTSIPELVEGLRRRWPSGIAIVTATNDEGGLRGVTVSSLMIVSQDPPVIGLALTSSGSFQLLAVENASIGVSFLEAGHEFAAERFAGRAPVPDANFTGVAYEMVDGVPVLRHTLGWCIGQVRQTQPIGDHLLVLLEVTHGELELDTDDPLLNYEGRYRRLEAG